MGAIGPAIGATIGHQMVRDAAAKSVQRNGRRVQNKQEAKGIGNEVLGQKNRKTLTIAVSQRMAN